MNAKRIGELSEEWIKANDPNYEKHKEPEYQEYKVPIEDIPFWIDNGWKESEDLYFMVKGHDKILIDRP